MNDVQQRIQNLQEKGWTLAAIADEVGVSWVTASRWRTGDQYPENDKAVLIALVSLLKRKRIPKKRRYSKIVQA